MKFLSWLPLYLFAFFILIYIFQGENAYFIIHDNLDSEISFRLLPKYSNTLFSFQNEVVVENSMNGIPRNCFNASSTNVISLIYYIFSPFNAYLINFLIVKSIAFFGVFLLLKNYLLKEYSAFIQLIIALTFSISPFYVMYGITVVGLPMLIWSLFSIYKSKHLAISWIFVLVFPFYSSLVLGGYVLIALLFFLFLYFIIFKKKHFNYLFLKIALLYCFLYVLAEPNLFNLFLNSNFVTHRSEWTINLNPDIGIYSVAKKSFEMLVNASYHSPIFHFSPFIALIFSFLFHRKKMLSDEFFKWGLIFILFSCILFGAYQWNVLIPIKQRFELLKTFQFHRFYFLLPVAWLILLVRYIHFQKGKFFITAILIYQLIAVFNQNKELKATTYSFLGFKNENRLTYKAFFAEDLFRNIENDIGKNKNVYRVINIGLFPSIAQYNGFYTLDSYQNNYALEYKNEFRKIMESELDQSVENQKYFDTWGNRCYYLANELHGKGYFITNHNPINIYFNANQFKKMGGKFVFSAVKIQNSEENKLRFIKEYSTTVSPLKVFVYKLEV